MGEGRGSAMVVAMIVMVGLAAVCDVAEAVTYNVGGNGGWTFNVVGWPKGKRFKTGDILVFNYAQGVHNVVSVDKGGYDGCNTTPAGAKVYTSGADQIKLKKGQNFFICNFPKHCENGMKIAVTAL